MKDKAERWSGLPLEAETQALSGELGRSLLFTHLLQQRVGTDRGVIDRFLQPRLGTMADPALMGDAPLAAKRILDAVAADEPMLIYGDYDVDGMTSVALLTLFFRHGLNHSVRSYLPQRLRDGYGLNIDMIERFAAEGVRLIITVDNGSSAVEAAARAQALGVDLIVVDHHQVSDPEPALFAHLNPNREACAYPEEGLAAVGVAFILLIELRRQLRADPRFQLPELRLERFLDLVAVGTLVDMAPMRGLNRALVRAGLEQLRRSEWPGLRALCQAQNLQGQKLRCRDIGFSLGPPLNASGRLGDPDAGARLLSAESQEEATTLCERVLEYNKERREIQRVLFEAAEPLAEAQVEAGRSLILIGDAGWHQGVVGIIAGRIAERFQRPTVVLGSPGQRGPEGSLSGSARSARGFDLKGSLDQCAELLLRHGGHREAAGLAVLETKISVLHDRLDALARDSLGEDSALCREVDAETQLSDLSWSLFGEIGTLAPFGVKNRPPRFLCRRVRGALNAFGRERLHLKLRFDDSGLDLREAIWWNHGHLLSELGRGPFDLIGVLERDEWKGERRLRLRLEALRVHRAEVP